MHQIAKSAGVGQATLYRRYTEIGDICIDIVKEECQPLFDEVDGYLGQNPDVPSLERFYHVIVRFVAFVQEKLPWLCSVSRAASDYRSLQSPLYQWMRDTCRTLLCEAQQRGEIADANIPYTVEALLAALHDLDFHLHDRGFSALQILQGLRRIYIDGLKK